MVEENNTKLKFLLSVSADKAEEVITYNTLLEFLQNRMTTMKFCGSSAVLYPIKVLSSP
jgi:hypothetical protein